MQRTLFFIWFVAAGSARIRIGLEELENVDEINRASPRHGEVRIRTLFQNPHWECFVRDRTGNCERGHRALYNGWINKYDIDFAGLAMGGKWTPPLGFGHIHHRSGPEDHDLAWNKDKWVEERSLKTEFRGGRAAILARFRSLHDPKVKVVVASMHYPHDKTGVSRIGRQIAELCNGHTDSVLFMADTNVGIGQSTELLMKELGVKGGVWHTPYRKTCCADTGSTFAFEFDRIWTNFGSRFRHIDDSDYMSMTNNLQHAPAFVKQAVGMRGGIAAWHHPIMAEMFTSSSTGTVPPIKKAIATSTNPNRDVTHMTTSAPKLPVTDKAKPRVKQRVSGQSKQKCGGLSDPMNSGCKESVMFAYNKGKYDKETAQTSYGEMENVSGISYLHAAPHDFQRLAYCGIGQFQRCVLPPCDCSKPPCDVC